VHLLAGHPGKVNAVAFDSTGSRLFVATGIAGTSGEVWCWNPRTGRRIGVLRGHHDILYALAVSPDGTTLATAGYDRIIRIWDLTTNQVVQTCDGHNGPVFDLDFAPDNYTLASASADATIKIWNAQTGIRLDTLSQPLQEQLSVDISPDGKHLVASGADNRIRLWRLVSHDQPQINPLLISRFAHDQPVLRVRYSPDGKFIASTSRDGTLKFWEASELRQLAVHPQPGDIVPAMDFHADAGRLEVARMDGSIGTYPVPEPEVAVEGQAANGKQPLAQSRGLDRLSADGLSAGALAEFEEQEPNDEVPQAMLLSLPSQVQGRIQGEASRRVDRDLYRFQANQGETWILEVNAARSQSKLDSFIQVLNGDGDPVPRVLLRAVRDSYFTFRGKDSVQTGDFRLHHWEEMRLNQLLYCSGEVVKLYHYPRGPDSGFNVYPNFGQRQGFFDTTPTTHALHETCYIVEPHEPGRELPANGLPSFTVYFENDDESRGRWGADSRLVFTAPETGEYICAIQDVRQLEGVDFTYTLNVRRPRRDFQPKLVHGERNVPLGGGQRFGVEIEREDDFEGPVVIEVLEVPDSLQVTSPLVIESGHLQAWGAITAVDQASASAETTWELPVIATAQIDGRTVRREVGKLGPIQIVPKGEVVVQFFGEDDADSPQAVTLPQGGSVTARIRIERHGFEGRVEFGKEDAVIGAPHGVFVSDTGLNGVLVRENEFERVVVLQAEPWVQPGEHQVFVEAAVGGKPTSPPVTLRIVRP
jgi:hypothetical protein